MFFFLFFFHYEIFSQKKETVTFWMTVNVRQLLQSAANEAGKHQEKLNQNAS